MRFLTKLRTRLGKLGLAPLLAPCLLTLSGCFFADPPELPAVPSALPLPPAETAVPQNLIDDSPRPAVVSPLPPTWTAEPTPLPSPVITSTPRITRTTETQSYVVQPGDTLGEIAEQFDVDIEELVRVNDLEDADHIEVGQELIIP
jgi:nucleoid-associated protein YgaU